MLNHLLAGIVGLGSLSLFLSGFFLPEVRRKPDFAWSGVGLIYALVLWIEGNSTPGGALLGHIASVALIVWFGWQTLEQRRQFATVEEQTAIPNSLEALTPFLKEGWGRMMVAYGEASSWVQDQLGKGDTGIDPEALTQQSQDWEDTSTASEPMDSAVAVAPEPLVTESAPEPEPTPTPPEAGSTSTVTKVPEPPKVESSAPSTTEESPESLTDSSEPEDPSNETESPVRSHDADEVERETEAIAAHQESAAHPESAPAPSTNPESPPSETGAALPVSKADDAAPTEPPAPSTHPEDDGSWPPPDPEA
jgi:Ycf66 protein N-terminus